MPAPITVTDEQIIEAGRQLAAKGTKVTGWKLKGVLKTGRGDRLGAVWAAHVAQAAEEVQAPPAPPLPAVLEEQAVALQMRMATEIESLIVSVWQTAERVAMDRMRGEIDAAREASAQIAVDLEDAEQIINDAEAERDQAVVEVEQMSLELQEARAEADRQRGHAEAAHAQVQRAEAATTAAMEIARMGAEERGRLLERVERAEAELRAHVSKQAEKVVA